MDNYLHCRSYLHPQLLLLLQDAPNYSLLSWESVEPTTLQLFAAWISPMDNYSRLPSIHSSIVVHCFTKLFGILSDLPKILRNLLLLLLLVCLHGGCFPYVWQYSVVSFVIFNFEHLIRYVCECSQSTITFRILPFGLDVTPDMSWCSTNQTLIDCRSMSIQLTCLWSEPLLLIPRFVNHNSFAFEPWISQLFL